VVVLLEYGVTVLLEYFSDCSIRVYRSLKCIFSPTHIFDI